MTPEYQILAAVLNITEEQLQDRIDAFRAKQARQAVRAKNHNESACRNAVGKAFRVKQGNTTYIGVVATAEIAEGGRSFKITIKSGPNSCGPFFVRQLPR